MKTGVAVYRASDQVYYADTCEALKHGVERGEVELVARARGAYPGDPFPTEAVPEVRTAGYWDAAHDQSWGLGWHRNEGIEITYVARGKVGFGVDGRDHPLRGGDLTITRPWQLHRVGAPRVTACRLYWLILDVGVRRPNQPWRWPNWLVWSEADRNSLTMNLSLNEQPVWPADEEIPFYFERLGEAVAAFDARTGDSRIKLYINGLLIALTEMLRRRQPTLDPSLSSSLRTVELFLATLRDHVDEAWTTDAMAAACGLHRSRFSHYCKQLTNMSPNDYLTRCRLEAAAGLLRGAPDLSVTDVALRSGFGSSQYFATVFRRHVGCSPREFRQG